MSINSFIAQQLSNPSGFGGKLTSYIMNRQNYSLYDETIKQLALSDADNVLDIGCGNGYVLDLLASRNNSNFTGIDTSPSILKSAARRNRKYISSGKMKLECENLSAMSFSNEAFNKIYTINTVYFWDNLSKAMNEINRILKPGGFFINTLFSNKTLSKLSHTRFGYKRYSLEQLEKSGVEIGLSVEYKSIMDDLAYCFAYQKKEEQ